LIAKAMAASFCRYYRIWIGAGFGSKMQTFSVGQILEAIIFRKTYFAMIVICQDGVLQRLVPLKCPFDVNRTN
jgi:hypothetical protein